MWTIAHDIARGVVRVDLNLDEADGIGLMQVASNRTNKRQRETVNEVLFNLGGGPPERVDSVKELVRYIGALSDLVRFCAIMDMRRA